ncbi:MAG TPA: HlyD family efflux transporter periplasmic adaptor subunit [Anaerolineae bacterium]|nr:HlyD family efflux transporter periplasmic adaptor subunit [Anaerolineae bacterium]
MKRFLTILIVVLILGGTGWLAWQWAQAHPDQVQQFLAELELTQAKITASGLTASGTIEAEMVDVTSELGGRIVALYVDEGDQVAAGQLLVQLDDTLLRAQLAQAEAAVALAQAQLDLLKAGARPEAIRQAEAQVEQARASVAGARQGWEDAKAIAADPQQLDLEIIAAETALAQAEHQARAAHLTAEAADLEVEAWGRAVESLRGGVSVPLPGGGYVQLNVRDKLDKANEQWNMASQRAWEAWEAAYAADAAVEGARQHLADLQARRENPQDLLRQVREAEAAYHQAEPAISLAEAGLQALQEGATEEQLDAARAQVEQASAALKMLQVQLAKTTVRAPREGVVVDRLYHEGEIAAPNVPIYRLADLSQVTLTLYVPETDLGKVVIGQKVQVTVDSFPNRVFIGRVVHIASEAEFTPKNVQTKEERVNLVFAVEVHLPNPDGLLKPGMPADAVILL